MLNSSVAQSLGSGVGMEFFEQVLQEKNKQISTMEKYISSMQREIKKKGEGRGSAETQKYRRLPLY